MSSHENMKTRKRTCLFRAFVLSWLCGLAASPAAQSPLSTRLAILQAEDRRAPTVNDLAIIRSGAHTADAQTMRMALRALGRLERPSLIADITPGLRQSVPELRAEAATAIGQAAQGWTRDRPATPAALDAAFAPLVARVDRLHLPSYTGFVMPKLDAVRNASGAITDVTISYPQDLTRQMLEYSQLTRGLRP